MPGMRLVGRHQGLPVKVCVYAYMFVSLKRKYLTSATPLSCALNDFILALKDSAEALVDLLLKKLCI